MNVERDIAKFSFYQEILLLFSYEAIENYGPQAELITKASEILISGEIQQLSYHKSIKSDSPQFDLILKASELLDS